MKWNVVLTVVALLANLQAWPAPVLRVATNSSGTALLRNGTFEELHGSRPTEWHRFDRGFQRAPGAGRHGSTAVLCENETEVSASGASQTLVLSRTNATPLVVRGWSRADGVTGGTDSGYSLYVDLTYEGGTSLWGQTADFRCGTHDWELREFVILPEKPVKLITLHCLFRGHAGMAWFDDVSLDELRAANGAVWF